MSDKAVHEEVVQLLKDYTDKGHDKENALQLVRSVIFLKFIIIIAVSTFGSFLTLLLKVQHNIWN